MADDTLSPAGLRARRAVLGESYVDDALSKVTAFDREWQAYVTNELWARTWSRGILSQQQLSLVTLALLAGRGLKDEFAIHFRVALERTHVPLPQLRELLMHIALYGGIGLGRECFAIANRVLKEAGADLGALEDR